MPPDRSPGNVSADTDPGVGRLSGDTTPGGPQGRRSAWLAFGLGVAVSVAANVAHTWYPARPALRSYAALHRGSAAGWRPEIGAQFAAAFYPLSLLLTVELLTRVRWPAGLAWAAARFGGTGVVAVVAAVVSYRHMAGLLAAYGEDRLTARIGPLAIDGLMVVASFALLALGRARPHAATPPADPTPARPPGARQAAMAPPDIPAATDPTVAAVPPATPPATPPTDPTPPPPTRQPPAMSGAMAGTEPARAATATGTTRARPPARRGDDADLRQRAEAFLARDPGMTGRALAQALGVSERSGQRLAREIRDALSAPQPDEAPRPEAGDAQERS